MTIVELGGGTIAIVQVYFHQQGVLWCSLSCLNQGVWGHAPPEKFSTSESVSGGYLRPKFQGGDNSVMIFVLPVNVFSPPWHSWRFSLRLCTIHTHTGSPYINDFFALTSAKSILKNECVS